jgi:hypothetical protein
MQYSEVRGGKSDDERVVNNNGILLIKNDLKMLTVCARSLRNVAFASTSNAAKIRSTIVDCISP